MRRSCLGAIGFELRRISGGALTHSDRVSRFAIVCAADNFERHAPPRVPAKIPKYRVPTGQLLKSLRPSTCRPIVDLLAGPREPVSYREIARVCRVGGITVNAIERAEAEGIGQSKAKLFRNVTRVAERAWSTFNYDKLGLAYARSGRFDLAIAQFRRGLGARSAGSVAQSTWRCFHSR
jgi:hypothetical protein